MAQQSGHILPGKCGSLNLLLLLLLGLTAGFCQSTTPAETSREANRHFATASRLAAQGKVEAAEAEYVAGLKLDPSSFEAHNNLGVLYFQKQNYSGAAKEFQEAHRLRPSDAEVSFNLGLAFFQSGNCTAALEPLELGASSTHRALDAHYLLGACHYNLKHWPLSIAELELVRKARPGDERVLFLLYNGYRQTGQPAKSLEAGAALLRDHPNSPFLHEILGEAHDTGNQFSNAEQEFKQAIAASPQAPELHFLLGYLYWRWKRYADAIAPLHEEVRISPGFAPSYFYLGDIALKQGKASEALGRFREALRLNASYGEAHLGMGRAYADLGKPTEALPPLRKAVNLLPGQVEPHYWLGKVLLQAGQSEEGKKELAMVDQLNARKRQEAKRQFERATHPATVSIQPRTP